MKQAELLNRGISLRRQGYSFAEISEQLGISKSTASLWLRNVSIDNAGIKRLIARGDNGRAKGIASNQRRIQTAWQKMADNSVLIDNNLEQRSVDECKLLLAMLYWGEGAKRSRSLIFMNSEPEMIKAFIFLMRKSFSIDESKFRVVIHLHDYHDKEEMVDYWSRVTDINKKQIRVYNKKNTGIRKKTGYKGCVSLRYYNSLVVDEVLLIIKRFHEAIK